ncbi:hypothetical protein [Thalassococcus sp. S3]|uniref:hypothetical protein n=1 Tax=Thalassococcus sp. S3 TaxID=2017482 RepID=UPI00102435B8|nr:hypothetical protein [Thalassococcus sp. S3]QBF32179.1 hypothetical protein CFI11_13255 [Thalassococcus sp. S3]
MTLLEITACMGELLEWAASARTKQLLDAGLTATDVMRLRRIGTRYQQGNRTYSDASFIWEILPALENVHITKPADS